MLETLRIVVTLGAFVSFLAILWWAYAPSRKEQWHSKGVLGDGE